MTDPTAPLPVCESQEGNHLIGEKVELRPTRPERICAVMCEQTSVFDWYQACVSVEDGMRLHRSAMLMIVGLLTACSQASTTIEPLFEVQTDATVVPASVTETAPFANPNSAAIAAALAQNPNLTDLRVTRIVGIYGDERIVDLRVEVQTDGFCHWYGVVGRVNDGVLEWRGGTALGCDGQ